MSSKTIAAASPTRSACRTIPRPSIPVWPPRHSGIEVLEVHVALSRDMFGPDVVASLTPAELRQLVDGIRFIERMRSHPVDKATAAAELAPLRHIFTKSVVAAADLPAGTVLTREHLAAKKPGTGIPARENAVAARAASSSARWRANHVLSPTTIWREHAPKEKSASRSPPAPAIRAFARR